MLPKEVVLARVDAFNRADVGALAALYQADAINHQVAKSPVHGREAIRAMFKRGFDTAEMVCVPENLFQDGAWPSWSGGTRKDCVDAASSTSLTDASRFSGAIGTSCPSSGFTAYPKAINQTERRPKEAKVAKRKVLLESSHKSSIMKMPDSCSLRVRRILIQRFGYLTGLEPGLWVRTQSFQYSIPTTAKTAACMIK